MRFWPQYLDISPRSCQDIKISPTDLIQNLESVYKEKTSFSEILQNIDDIPVKKVVAQYLEMVLSSAELESCENKIITDETELLTPKLGRSIVPELTN